MADHPKKGDEPPLFFHDPPTSGYLGPLARELTVRGVPARMTGRGVTAFILFEDPELAGRFGRIYFNQPRTSGRSTFMWKDGDEIGPVSDIEAIAELVVKAVNPECTEDSTE